jgi:putative oxidoreductase
MKLNRIIDLNWTFRVLTIGLGVLMLFHGVHKVLNGIDFIIPLLEAYNVPYAEYVSYGVYVGEIFAPLLLISGYYIRVAGAIIVFNMLVAIFLVHQAEILTLTEHGSWSIETPMLYLIIGLALLLSKEPHR